MATGKDSPVKGAWLTITSPSVTMPSTGMTPPIRTTIRSPGRIWDTGVNTSPAGVLNQTRSTFRDIHCAKSCTDFFLVHSSRSSPSSSRNITEPAVAKSRRIMEREIETASSSSTFILPCFKQRSPLRRKGTACHSTRAIRRGAGKNSVLTSFNAAFPTSFSSNWRLSMRLL